ncbi:MAG: glycosyl transferase family 1 [Candidatus Marinimicrobia bacterium]|nr:glycosyl transferase family 1 [Candidatus Neomarinimicrobiota bacterium]
MLKVLAFTRYANLGASSRLRFYQYISAIKLYNIEIDPSPLFNENYIDFLYLGKGRSFRIIITSYIKRIIKLFSVARYDLVIIEKELFPYLPGVFESLLYLFNKRHIVDYDDAVFHLYDQSNNFYVKFLAKKIDLIMRRSDLVICGNEYIYDRAKAVKSKRVELLPTVVDTEKYHTAPLKKSKTIIIGWIGNPSTVHCLELVRDPLNILSERFEIVLNVIGAQFNSDVFKVNCIKWEEDTEVKNIQEIDIGIMPLHDGPFEKGKCGYKLIQYMACGKPVVASPVGVNKKIVRESNSGCLAITEKDWIDELSKLCDSTALREKYGSDAIVYIEKYYSMKVTLPIFANLLNTLE